MRVVQVTESLEIGGAERVVVVLANALARRHQVSVVCAKRIGALAAGLDPRVKVDCLGKGEGNDPRLIAHLYRYFRTQRVDVVHTHDWGVFLDTMIAARLARVRTRVHTVHGEYMAYPPGKWPARKKALRHWLERRVAPLGTIACVSDALRAHVGAEVGIADEAMVTIPNGIAVGPPPVRAPLVPADTVRFITVGRLAPVKNVALLLDAFAQVVASHSNVSLRIVGDGPERARLEQQAAQLGISAQVDFAGFRSDTDALLGAADAFVLPSLSEGIPMAVLEAMRAGLPVVATRVGGIPTTVADGATGILVESRDVAGLGRALMRVIEDRGAAEAMGRAGFDRVAALFSMDAMVSGYERLYAAGAGPA